MPEWLLILLLGESELEGWLLKGWGTIEMCVLV
jgi:hypothetical protein